MVSALEYLAQSHQRMRDLREYDYNAGLHSERIAKLLLAEGKNPQIEHVYEEVKESGRITVKSFAPVMFKGKMPAMHSHRVCVADDLMYDPIIGIPVPKKDYCMLAFGEEIKMSVSSTTDDLRKSVRI